MNIIDYIERKEFLTTIFPNGINSNLLIGNIELRLDGNLKLYLHTTQPPAKEVPKWGTWGKDYNVIVIEVICSLTESLKILGWQENDFSQVQFLHDNGKIHITAASTHYSIDICCQGITFQRCNTYIL